MLEPVGLTDLEERVYETLVPAHAATLSALATRVGASRARVAHAVERLTALGLVNRLSGVPARFSAIVPELGLVTLVRGQEEALAKVRVRAAELTEAYRQAVRTAHPAELVEIVTGVENVLETFVRLQDRAREQLRGLDTGPYFDPDPTRENVAESRALSKGVTYRTIYDRGVFDYPGRARHVRAAISVGEQARVATRLPMKMVLCDEQAALIPVGPPTLDRAAAYLIYPSALFDALSALFEAIWDSARPLAVTADGGVEQDEPDEDDARLLRLLAEGATDAAMSRALDCSLRTMQRRVRALMHRLGVTTRFQAGLEARARGWV